MSICANYRRIPANLVDKLEDEDFSHEALSKCERLSLDKSWGSLHLFLNGSNTEDGSPLSKAIHGGSTIGDIEDGESILTSAEVAEIDKALQSLDSNKCAERMTSIDPDELDEMDIYSFDIDSLEDYVEEARANFDALRDFYRRAAENTEAVLVSLA